jgi:hypothetical protein
MCLVWSDFKKAVGCVFGVPMHVLVRHVVFEVFHLQHGVQDLHAMAQLRSIPLQGPAEREKKHKWRGPELRTTRLVLIRPMQQTS